MLDASGAELDWDVHQVGLAALAAGAAEPLPARTVRAIADCGVALKGPLTTPLDGSMASMNMALRRELDLHVQLRHVRRFTGVPGHHEQVDLVVVRQTTEDVFVGIEFAAGSEHAEELAEWLRARGKQLPPRSALAVKVSSAAGAGRGIAVFEPAHGSAPRYAGQDRANPVATILSGARALHHLGEREAALRVEAAVCTVLAGSRYRKYDLTPGRSGVGAVGTAEFARSVADAIL